MTGAGRLAGRFGWVPIETVDLAQSQQGPVVIDEREQYCTEPIQHPCLYPGTPNGM